MVQLQRLQDQGLADITRLSLRFLIISFLLNRYLRVMLFPFTISISLHSEHKTNMWISFVTPKLDRLSPGLTITTIGALKLQGTMEMMLPSMEGTRGRRVSR